jgi:hypothetical protein|tara:strand:+ start:432 stop:668 length:237 start_codon:yes stop_codon:yes gene_type:complete
MKIKPHYIVNAYSPSKRKLIPQFMSTEHGKNKHCTSLIEARRRSIEFAKSLCEAKRENAIDWEPRIQLINDQGKLLVG